MKSLEQELRDGNYDINDVLNDETSERRVFLARMGRDVEALAGTPSKQPCPQFNSMKLEILYGQRTLA